MIANIGMKDRTVRFLLGFLIGTTGLIMHQWWGLIALIPIGTAMVSFCPLYLPFGISTKK